MFYDDTKMQFAMTLKGMHTSQVKHTTSTNSLSVGFVFGALLTLTLAASVQAWVVEADTNDNEDTASKCKIL